VIPFVPPITRDRFDAVLFDLDGVLTDTAQMHARCWKRVFDDLLARRARMRGEGFRPFDARADYRAYVDGKPRLEGARDFLASRDVTLPEGDVDSPPEADTLHGVAGRKDALVGAALARGEVAVFPDAVRWLDALHSGGFRTAVVSSSHHCAEVLRAAGIGERFEVRVDGSTIDARGLAGKPAPDTFLAAATELGVAPRRAIVVEDARAGVAAGRAGGFGLVIGVARHDDADALSRAGADLVVSALTELVT
jgi:beta-phosphoglucomutase family hydrolase